MAEDVKQAPQGDAAGVVGKKEPLVDKKAVNIVESKEKGRPAEIRDENGKLMMKVKVYSPFESFFDDNAYSITALNHTGEFDILPRHKNFMTMIDPCDVKVKAPSGDATIRINKGLMHVKYDQVILFVDI